MNVKPIDIQQKQFKVRFRGFDVREVDAFLDQVAVAFETLAKEKDQLQFQIGRFKKEVHRFQQREESLKEAVLNSQKITEQMKANARKTAELIEADAEVKAEKMLNRAHNRLAKIHEDISELKRQRIQLEVKIRSIIETHTKY